jgi:cardiolipin synthase
MASCYTIFMGIRISYSGKAFYDHLENEIARAKKEVLINVYAFQYDGIGKRFIEILKRKLDEGITVKVILDGLGSRRNGEDIVRALAPYGDVVRVFRPRGNYLARHPVTFCRRDHARIFLIDRKSLGIGGMCIGDIYDRRQDIAVLLPVTDAGSVVSYFNDLWMFAGNKQGNDPVLRTVKESPRITPSVRTLISGPHKEAQEIYGWALAHIRSAKKRIVIVSAWFLPASELIHELCHAKARGVAITIVTPSHTDKQWYDDFRGGAISRLLEKNVAWYGTGEYFHQKYFLADDAWCLGSANFDMISMNRNYELNLCGRGDAMLQELEANFSALQAGGEPIRRAKINWFVRCLERAVYPIFEMFIVTRE